MTAMAVRLKKFVEQIEGVEQTVASANLDKAELYKAAKQQGLSPKVIKRVVAERRKDPADREQSDTLFQQYWIMVHEPIDIEPKKEHARARPKVPHQIDIEEAITAAREAAE